MLFFVIRYLHHKGSTNHDGDGRYGHHRTLVGAHPSEDGATAEGCDNLGQTDGSVEEPEISSLVAVALQRTGHKALGHREHAGPAAADEQEGDDLQILVVYHRDECEAQSA